MLHLWMAGSTVHLDRHNVDVTGDLCAVKESRLLRALY